MEVKMKKHIMLAWIVAALSWALVAPAYGDLSVPKNKQTVLGLYVTAREAFTRWHTDKARIKILDVRSPGEYIFVGHAPMAVNIPIRFLGPRVDAGTNRPVMPLNENFVADVQKRFKPADTLLVMCRSGGRSAAAVDMLAKAGYKNVYNIVDGFEGDALKLPGSYNNGRRLVNGWKNSGAPWTYRLDPQLTYNR
jgi:rhodanese-related sulfurtransferase